MAEQQPERRSTKMTSPLPYMQVGPAQAGVALRGERIAGKTREFGIYTADGQVMEHSGVQSALMTTAPSPAPDLSAPEETLDGPVLFAGLAGTGFGDVLLNSLGRLWALEQLPPETKLLYVPQLRPLMRKYPHLEPVLRALGLENEVHLARSSTALSEVYLVPELYGDQFGGHGARGFFHWLDQRWWPEGPVSLGRKVYVSRSGLGPEAERFACEDHLEALLAADGYEIYHPQDHDLRHQVATYQDAERLIFAESPALHLYALIRRPLQTAAVIQRQSALPRILASQLEARAGLPVAQINVVRKEFAAAEGERDQAVSLLDFEVLREELMSAGLLSPRAAWSEPEAEAEAASLVGARPDVGRRAVAG